MLPEALAATVGLCLAVATRPEHASASEHFLATLRFTLAWTHSRERTRWEEDYRITPPDQREASPLLHLVESRVKGSGAGVDPGPTARLENGWYRDRARRAPLTELVLARSEHVADYELCAGDTRERLESHCLPLANFLPKSDPDEAAQSVRLSPCQR